MLKSGEVSGRYLINGGVQWTKDVLLFMFDQAIVVCKKDLLKKNFYIFKDRMSLESVTLVDCKDGKGEFYLGIRYKELLQSHRSGCR